MKDFDYWMLTEMNEVLNKEYQKRSIEGKYGSVLKHVAKEQGNDVAKKLQADFDSNRFHPLGKIAAIQKRIQEIKDQYSDAVEDVRQNHTEIEFING